MHMKNQKEYNENYMPKQTFHTFAIQSVLSKLDTGELRLHKAVSCLVKFVIKII